MTKNYNFTFLYVSETNSNLDINNHNTDSRDVIASVWLRLSLSPKTTSGSSSFWLGNDRSLQQGQHLLQLNTHRYTATHVQIILILFSGNNFIIEKVQNLKEICLIFTAEHFFNTKCTYLFIIVIVCYKI
jgi:hypothetical protein